MKPMIHLRRYLLIAVVLLLATSAGTRAQDKDYGVKTHQLKNGMRILVQEDHSIPNVALYIYYKIGSRNERPGTTGLSHFFEHMMFNGAKKYGPKQFDEVMEAAGGSNNAFTSNDVTAYQDWFPRSALETIFDLEADRIQNLNFDEKMIESEWQESETGRKRKYYRLCKEGRKALQTEKQQWMTVHETLVKLWKTQY